MSMSRRAPSQTRAATARVDRLFAFTSGQLLAARLGTLAIGADGPGGAGEKRAREEGGSSDDDGWDAQVDALLVRAGDAGDADDADDERLGQLTREASSLLYDRPDRRESPRGQTLRRLLDPGKGGVKGFDVDAIEAQSDASALYLASERGSTERSRRRERQLELMPLDVADRGRHR